MKTSSLRNWLTAVAMRVFKIPPMDRKEQKAIFEKRAKELIGDTYLEDDPLVAEWFRGLVPSSQDVASYVKAVFPSAIWIRRYNMHWFLGDIIAGVTVGLVVVPQAMAYATLARLTPAFGLYTSFTGGCLYWIFGTSKDIVIGATAVGSLLVGSVITKIEAEHAGIYKPEDIAHALSFIVGIVVFSLGLLRLGWLIEFIPSIPISAFVTSASITIVGTQLPTVLGITGINTRQSPHKVYADTIKSLHRADLNAAIGITSIVLLWLIQSSCSRMEVRRPQRKRLWSLISSLRLAFTVLLYTFISWLVNRGRPAKEAKFRIVGHIEKGFSHAGLPPMKKGLFGLLVSELPAVIIILIVEHIAIAKSFGRICNYTVIPSQEMIAQGAANILSPLVGGYVCTGSFSGSAVLSKAAVRTPLSGLFSAIVLVLALYALTEAFYFIPNAALGGLIIHCTANLITPPRSLYEYWHLSPFELFIWVCGVVVALFSDLQTAIYVTAGLSLAMLFTRMAKCPGTFRGSVGVTRIVRNSQASSQLPETTVSGSNLPTNSTEHAARTRPVEASREVCIPYGAKAGHNPTIKIEPVYPGIFIYRFSETFNYINQAYHMNSLTSYIMSHTRCTQVDETSAKDHLWCNEPPSPKLNEERSALPFLRAVILDMATVNIIDLSSVQGLVDLRNALDRYAAPTVVEWHFAGIQNRWTRRVLSFAGFSYPEFNGSDDLESWYPAYTVTPRLEDETEKNYEKAQQIRLRITKDDEENQSAVSPATSRDIDKEAKRPLKPLYGVDRPFFHLDVHDAVDMAVRNAKKRDR